MIRLHMVVEGQTEETFVREVLSPELWPLEIFPDARCVETGRRGAYIHRGGGWQYSKWKKDLTLWMKEDQHPEVWFTSMVDLYRLPTDFPGYEACGTIPDPHARVQCLEKYFRDDINHPQFIPYIQLHEFETILFADVASFETVYPGETAKIAQLAAVRNSFPSIDHINNGQHSAPSKRILAVFPEYDKALAGSLIAIDIGLPTICAESPHFNQWFQLLKELK